MSTPIIPTVPAMWTTFAVPGSQWVYSFQLQNDDGTLMNITNKTFELVVRTSSRASSPVFTVTTTSGANGQITVNTATSTIQVVASPTATALLTGTDVYAVALWMDPNLTDATALLTGTMTARVVAAP